MPQSLSASRVFALSDMANSKKPSGTRFLNSSARSFPRGSASWIGRRPSAASSGADVAKPQLSSEVEYSRNAPAELLVFQNTRGHVEAITDHRLKDLGLASLAEQPARPVLLTVMNELTQSQGSLEAMEVLAPRYGRRQPLSVQSGHGPGDEAVIPDPASEHGEAWQDLVR